MSLETYEQSGPGPIEVVKIGTPYRALRLDAAATENVTLTVTSGNKSNQFPYTLVPDVIYPGSFVVISGATAQCHGYLP